MISSRKLTSGCTTTISLHPIIQLSSQLKLWRCLWATNNSWQASSVTTTLQPASQPQGRFEWFIVTLPNVTGKINHCHHAWDTLLHSAIRLYQTQQKSFHSLSEMCLENPTRTHSQITRLCFYSQCNWLTQQQSSSFELCKHKGSGRYTHIILGTFLLPQAHLIQLICLYCLCKSKGAGNPKDSEKWPGPQYLERSSSAHSHQN